MSEMLAKIFKNAIENGTFPGAVLLIGNSQKILFLKSYGYKALKPVPKLAEISTIYDLASLTKVVATTPAIMKLIEKGKIRLSDPVEIFLAEFSDEKKSKILIRHLLTHTSGFPPYTDAWKKVRGHELLERINAVDLVNDVGKKYLYSCLNFVVLMEIVEVVSGEKFEDFVKKYLFEPLDMKSTFFRPVASLKEKIAPTSQREDKILLGEVDDEIAYYLGGVSGNAGLFSTAEDLYKYAKMLLNDGMGEKIRLFSQANVRAFRGEAFNDGEIRRALGWELKATNSSCGDLMSNDAYGHTGFTGTSMWIDPIYDVAVVLLTNRVHISRRGNQKKMIRFRALLHNYIMGHLEEWRN